MPAKNHIFSIEGRGELEIRPPSRGDLQGMLWFARSLVRERKTNHDLGIVSLDRRVSVAEERKYLRRILTESNKRNVVAISAFDGNKMVANCDIWRRKPYDVRHTGVLGIAIVEGYRGAGLGQALIQAALRRSAKIGLWLVELQVFENNARARHIYEKIGFKMVGVVPNKIQRKGRSINEVTMYIDLRGSDKSTGTSRSLH